MQKNIEDYLVLEIVLNCIYAENQIKLYYYYSLIKNSTYFRAKLHQNTLPSSRAGEMILIGKQQFDLSGTFRFPLSRLIDSLPRIPIFFAKSCSERRFGIVQIQV